MNVLLVGGGGREHALAWKLKQSPSIGRLFAAPGNAGILEIATLAPIEIARHDEVLRFCREAEIGLVVIGPEAPLVAGLSDALRAAGIPVFGPSKAAAQIEASKSFMKSICDEKGISTAAYATFSNAADATDYVRNTGAPLVIKADGLAAGKGVFICPTPDDAHKAIEACFTGAFGEAGALIVIEEMLEGEEVSFFAISDGKQALPLAFAQDYKRAFDGDTGPNTGGMGAISPAPIMTDALTEEVMQRIVVPTLEAMASKGMPFQGVLYAGLMITASGPKLIEYNARFGDPECQVLMLRLKSDLLPILLATAKGEPPSAPLAWSGETAIAVVMAAEGYPGPYKTDTIISGLDDMRTREGAIVFHAGTAKDAAGRILAKGGRVLNVCATGSTASEAQAKAYDAASKIVWPEGFYRRDIGWRSVAREKLS